MCIVIGSNVGRYNDLLFFQQKTAYEMRIIDWSSDVCSSDLSQARRAGLEQGWDIGEIKVPNPNRPSEFWFYVPALLILALIWFKQGVRLRREGMPAPVPV